jgi:hypothetical protein
MADTPEASVFAAYRNARGGNVHPHLDPINGATFLAERTLARQKAVSLLGYQKYLAAARATKAKRKGATMAFERNVLAQARQAQLDLEQFSGAVLRATQRSTTRLCGVTR